jgi:hypothetical protein
VLWLEFNASNEIALGIAAEILFEARKKIAVKSPAEGNAPMLFVFSV